MPPNGQLIAFSALVGIWLTVLNSTLPAQSSRSRLATKQTVPETRLSFELVTGKSGVGIQAQKWGKLFQKLGVPLRIRRAGLKDKPQVREKMFGITRLVSVIGRLDRNGKVVFPDRSFTPADTSKLAVWLEELKTYGAQGSPQGKPAFGLNQVQFGHIYSALSEIVTMNLEGQELDQALAKMQLSVKYPIRITAVSNAILRDLIRVPTIRQRLKGFSKGTAIAAALADYGLGFRPLRTPSGSIELVVDPLTNTVDCWPIGWPQTESNIKTAPMLYKWVPVDLQDVPLKDVLDAVAAATEVPILIDYHQIEKKGIDIFQVKVSFPSKKTTWSLLLKSIANPEKLTRRLMIDERGQPFVWVTPIEVVRLKR